MRKAPPEGGAGTGGRKSGGRREYPLPPLVYEIGKGRFYHIC